jgi:uncharacterized membrane protein YedE/YeeE
MEFTIHLQILLSAFGIGLIFGAVANRTNFCTLGAVSDWLNMGDTGRMRAWLLAIAVSLACVTAMEAAGMIDVSANTFPPYRTPNFALLRYVVGGLMFGIGMTLASGCGSKTLIRIGGGNLKSVTAFVVAAGFAYLMLWSSLFEQAFLPWVQATSIDLSKHGMPTQELGSVLARAVGIEPGRGFNQAVSALVALTLVVYVFSSAEFRGSIDNILGGSVVGLTVAAGWYLTGGPLGAAWKDYAEMATEIPSRVQTQSLTFISPMGDGLRYLMSPANTSLINFGIASLCGVILGSFFYAIFTRGIRIEKFASRGDFGSHVLGGALMGMGAVLAMGCTIGQGVTGLSTLAIGSIVTFLSIVAGSVMTMKYQYWRMMQEA